MSRYVVDVGAALHLAAAEMAPRAEDQLLAPTLLRSEVLSSLHAAVHRGELTSEVGRARLARFGRLPIRLLGDGVLRRRAWEVADRLGWPGTFEAEYVALTLLQAEALVTTDDTLAERVQGLVEVLPVGALLTTGPGTAAPGR